MLLALLLDKQVVKKSFFLLLGLLVLLLVRQVVKKSVFPLNVHGLLLVNELGDYEITMSRAELLHACA